MDEASGELGGNEMISKRRRAPEKWNWTVRLAKDWEGAFFATATPRTRRIALRTSLVLSPAPGSAFAKLSNLVRAGLGGTQGNGRQYVSWIHEADYARALEFLIDHEEIEGPVNLAALHLNPARGIDGWGPRDFLLQLNRWSAKRITLDKGPHFSAAAGFVHKLDRPGCAAKNRRPTTRSTCPLSRWAAALPNVFTCPTGKAGLSAWGSCSKSLSAASG